MTDEPATSANPPLGDNVHHIHHQGRDVYLIGTAHVSHKSVQEVEDAIQSLQPDTICVELCDQRYQSIKQENQWKNMDIIQVIKEKKAFLLLSSLVLSAFQKRMADQFDIKPGQEMIAAIDAAEHSGATLVLADRNIHTTLKRAWRNVSFLGKIRVISELLAAIFDKNALSQEAIEEMKTQDIIASLLDEIGTKFPKLKAALIDERDTYLASKIYNAPGKSIVAVVGAGHIPGIRSQFAHSHDLTPLDTIPQPNTLVKVLAWTLPLLIIALIVSTFSIDQVKGMEQITSWIFWNATMAGIGAVIALGHPLTILTAIIASPITSLNPLLGAGWFAGFVEALLRKPKVIDFENLSQDASSIKGFWKNPVTRILLVVFLSSVGSSLGAWIGGFDVMKSFFEIL